MCLVEVTEFRRLCMQASYETTWFVRLVSDVGGHARIGGPLDHNMSIQRMHLEYCTGSIGAYLLKV